MSDGLVAALARCQAKFGPIVKSHTNPAFKGSQYADIADVLAVVRPVLAAEGIAVSQLTDTAGEGVVLVTALLFGEQRLESRFPLPVENATAQQVGSMLTYHRRYQLCALLGVHPEGDDDDGNAAGSAPQARATFGLSESTFEPADVAQSREAIQEAIAGLIDADRELVKLECRNQKVPSLRKPGATRAQLDGLVDFIAGLRERAEPFDVNSGVPIADLPEPQPLQPTMDLSGDERPPFRPQVAGRAVPGSRRMATDSAMKADT